MLTKSPVWSVYAKYKEFYCFALNYNQSLGLYETSKFIQEKRVSTQIYILKIRLPSGRLPNMKSGCPHAFFLLTLYYLSFLFFFFRSSICFLSIFNLKKCIKGDYFLSHKLRVGPRKKKLFKIVPKMSSFLYFVNK